MLLFFLLFCPEVFLVNFLWYLYNLSFLFDRMEKHKNSRVVNKYVPHFAHRQNLH